MVIYIVDVLVTGFLSKFDIKEFDDNGIETYQSKRKRFICLSLILLLWVCLFAFRGTTGGDTGVYRAGYKNIFRNGLSLQDCFEQYRDKLYIAIAYYCAQISGGSWLFACFVFGFLVYTPIIVLISKKSEEINLSCILYLCTLQCFFAFNGVRQALATSFAIYAYYFGLRDKKIIKYIIFLLVAYGFHASVLLVIPFQLLSLKKLKKASTVFLILLLFGSSVVFNQVWSGFADLFGSNELVSKYSTVIQYAHGSSVIRVLVWLVPIVFGIYLYPKLSDKYPDADHDILMVLFGAVFMVYSMFDTNFSQMSIYFMDVNLILYPKLFKVVSDQHHKIFKTSIVVVYFLYMIMLLFNGDMGLNPYVPVWISGNY